MLDGAPESPDIKAIEHQIRINPVINAKAVYTKY